MGGGEVMLLALAHESVALGHEVEIIGPEEPGALIAKAREYGYRVTPLRSTNRIDYMISLRRWWRGHNADLLWCNGLLPAVATSGMKRRIVHLHQIPSAKLRRLLPIAMLKSMRVIVPSDHMTKEIPGSVLLPNWSNKVETTRASRSAGEVRIGFIGRFSSDKGLPTLIDATNFVSQGSSKSLKLVLAGAPRFVGEEDQKRVQDSIDGSSVPVDQIGWVPPSEFFSNVDFVVVPSVWQEPFGLVATEAMSAKVPLVVSDAGALPEIVGPDHPWIASAGDSESLAEVLSEALEVSSSDIELIVDRLFRRWQKYYSPAAGRRGLNLMLSSLRKA
ncbi:glycosyltransferase family 4 protein [Neomicrococcus lactis]